VRAVLLLILIAAAPLFARAGDGLSDALAARALLGPDIWARVVRIDNSPARGLEVRTAYPSTVYALVFELSGVLLFYCDADGTQSLSLRYGTLDSDKADPGPLFRAISHRFGRWDWVDESPALRETGCVPPPNSCVIQCIAALRARAAAGKEIGAPQLLFFYVDTPNGRLGHSVLLYASGGGMTAVDPDRPSVDIRIPARLAADARAVTGYLRRGSFTAVRLFPIEGVARTRPATLWATLAPAAKPAG
jgi:hypothetical protein